MLRVDVSPSSTPIGSLQRGIFRLGAILLTTGMAGCASFLPAAGPSQSALRNDASQYLKTATAGPALPFVMVDLNLHTVQVASKVHDTLPSGSFARFRGHLPELPIGVGDVVSVTIFEAAPGGLFIPAGSTSSHGNSVEIPKQEVDRTGNIMVPFAGTLHAAGKRPSQLAHEIEDKLKQRAIEPQVVVSFEGRGSTIVTVTGAVNKPGTVQLSQGGDRVLDVLSAVQGSKYADFETMVTLQRGKQSATMRLSAIERSPKNNIYVKPHDVLIVKRDPQYFYVFGASGVAATSGYSRTAAYNFQHANTNLAEVLATAGGLLDSRADPRWVVLYRLENRSTLERYGMDVSKWRTERIPTVYRLNLKDPSGFFLAQHFPIENNDLVYVSTASYVDVSLIAQLMGSFSGTAANVNAAQR